MKKEGGETQLGGRQTQLIASCLVDEIFEDEEPNGFWENESMEESPQERSED